MSESQCIAIAHFRSLASDMSGRIPANFSRSGSLGRLSDRSRVREFWKAVENFNWRFSPTWQAGRGCGEAQPVFDARGWTA